MHKVRETKRLPASRVGWLASLPVAAWMSEMGSMLEAPTRNCKAMGSSPKWKVWKKRRREGGDDVEKGKRCLPASPLPELDGGTAKWIKWLDREGRGEATRAWVA